MKIHYGKFFQVYFRMFVRNLFDSHRNDASSLTLKCENVNSQNVRDIFK